MIDYTSLINRLCSSTGSTWVTEDELLSHVKKYGGRIQDIDAVIGKGVCRETNLKGEVIYTTQKIADMEMSIADNVMRLMYTCPPKQFSDELIEQIVHEFEEKENEGRQLHFRQVDAVKMVVNNNFSVLTGGPGTGKTTVLSAITYTLRTLLQGISIVYTAPTGKAAKRISESTGENASTLHKKLGLGFNTKKPDYFYEDVLFIDESSMNDTYLSNVLFIAVTTGRKVVFVGDIHQLPSVGPGAVLRDLIKSGVVPVTMLTHTFRQAQGSTLAENIKNVRDGIPEIIVGDDYIPIELSDEQEEKEAENIILKEYLKGVEEYGAENCVVLLPYRKRMVCSNKVNNTIQKYVNRKTQAFRFTNEADKNVIFFKEGDYVMQLENREECANGDVGQVTSVAAEGVTVTYVDGVVLYKQDELSQLALAYAMSIHKSQGSEYKCVIMVMLKQHEAMLSRNLLYTGITRAKKKCILVYNKEAYEKALSIKADALRVTNLATYLQRARAKYKTLYGVA